MSNRAGGNARAAKYDHLIKLLLIGDSGVGKSCLLLRYSDDSFTSSFITTIGIDFKIKTIMCGEAKVKLQIWDTAGQERFRTITTAYYRGAMGILLVYDVSDETSFVNVRNWMKQIDQNAAENVNRILIGNKCDVDASERKIPSEKGKALADEYGIKFFETSAKLYVNVDECFMDIAKDIVEHLKENPDGSSGILEMPPRRDRRGRTPFYPKTCLALAAVGYFASYWIWDWTKSTDLLLGLTSAITYISVLYFGIHCVVYPILLI